MKKGHLEYQKVIKTYLPTYQWDSSYSSDSCDSSDGTDYGDISDNSDQQTFFARKKNKNKKK